MDKKDMFKEFVKSNPILLKHVQNGSMTWQKFYEIYDMYGADSNMWKDYLTEDDISSVASTAGALGFFDFIKNLDFDSIQTGVNSMQRVLSLLQDMTNKNNKSVNSNKENYTPRPLYKHFED